MKFIYTGQTPIKDVDLVLAGIFKPEDRITHNKVFEIPDDKLLLIKRVMIQGIYEPYIEMKKVRPKKTKTKKEKKEEKVEEEK